MTELSHTSGTSGRNRRRTVGKRVGIVAAVALIAGAIALAVAQPRADRTWVPQHAVMAHAEVRGHEAHLHRLRNFSYTAEDQFTPAYDDRTYDLDKLETVWF